MRINNFKIIPDNPNYISIDDKTCYKSLNHIKQKIDIVNIFRRSSFVYSIVIEAISINASAT